MKGRCSHCSKIIVLTPKQRHNFRHGRNVYCSTKCRTLGRGFKPGGMFYHGKCKICGGKFKARYPGKIYCNIDCYQKDPLTLKRLKKISKKGLERRRELLKIRPEDFGRTVVPCDYCGEEINRKKSRIRNSRRQFCNQGHYRKFMADRFDRWIANPQEIALPQNYDEFMTQEALPCLIEGCAWEGKHLASHVNLEHGILADEFKKMAGFNLTTGLVTSEVSETMSQKAIDRGCDWLMPYASQYIPAINQNKYSSLEGREHSKKARILGEANHVDTSEGRCLWCYKKFFQPYASRRLYCSVDCRSEYYKKENNKNQHGMVCAFCSKDFKGNNNQKRRSDKGFMVVCSVVCRNTLNVKSALRARGVS